MGTSFLIFDPCLDIDDPSGTQSSAFVHDTQMSLETTSYFGKEGEFHNWVMWGKREARERQKPRLDRDGNHNVSLLIQRTLTIPRRSIISCKDT
mmetsp:Transcript_1650/g.3091  ORF Transcript_1650/g.3091 Transcript_1650/m.3091 type:complete len:94 (+) Transcript_1650:472-753(+)